MEQMKKVCDAGGESIGSVIGECCLPTKKVGEMPESSLATFHWRFENMPDLRKELMALIVQWRKEVCTP